ncbi:nucleotidyltransferase domain-containing protein [Actinoplanes sp. CA-131856]
MTPDIEAWQSWHPSLVAARLAGVETPWYVAAGWAIDLHLGGELREHEDTEIAVPESRFAEIAGRFPELAFYAPAGKGVVVPATPEALAEHHQTWAMDPSADVWRLDVFREPHDGDIWISRRHESLRRPYSEIILRTPDGIPYLSPDVVLLFKAKHGREKDQRDYDAAAPHLTAAQRDWLDRALDLVHPGHAWRS